MRIERMTARFGKLNDDTLVPGAGLTVIEAANESGKSTWCAFIRTMLYGLSTREREKKGFIPDKTRYAPWNGTGMRGVLVCTAEGRSLTLTRDTVRANAPMGDFHAVYTGTAEEVKSLTALNCGESLLGVPREVFERSAFIRESSLVIDHDAELERRIAALLSTGEEDRSYSEVYQRLNGWRNRRRHNKTGLLPQAETELDEVQRQIDADDEKRNALRLARSEREAWQKKADELAALLHRHELADATEERRSIAALRLAWEQAEQTAQAARNALVAAGAPSEDALQKLGTLCGDLDRESRAFAEAEKKRDAAARDAVEAERAWRDHPFAPAVPEDAERLPLPVGEKPKFPIFPLLAAVLLAAVLACLLWKFVAPLAAAVCPLLGGCAAAFMGFAHGKKKKVYENSLAEKQAERARDLAAYADLYIKAHAAEEDRKKADALCAVSGERLHGGRQELFAAVRLFSPDAQSLPDAEAAISEMRERHRAREDAERLAENAKLRYDTRRETRRFPETGEDAERPAGDPEALRAEYGAVLTRCNAASQEESRISGSLLTAEDYAALTARREALADTVPQLQEEYDALTLAMETLTQAGDELQSRFSPALGRATAALFARLTGGRYEGVFLDRELNARAVANGDAVPREFRLLSRGSADQLYLALRLAICEAVLPEEKSVPLILDDALSSFDDGRAETALRCLVEESRKRQILLFTCQSREARLLAGEPGVTFITL